VAAGAVRQVGQICIDFAPRRHGSVPALQRFRPFSAENPACRLARA
jgi:hypothetical protein